MCLIIKPADLEECVEYRDQALHSAQMAVVLQVYSEVLFPGLAQTVVPVPELRLVQAYLRDYFPWTLCYIA
jgi:hypothetical protein